MNNLTLRLAVKAKCIVQRLGLRPAADVYVGFARGWRYPQYLIRALRCAGSPVLEVPRGDVWIVANEGSLRDLFFRTRIMSTGERPTAPVVIDRDPTVVAPDCPIPVTLSIDWFSEQAGAATVVLPYFKHPSMWRFDADLDRLSRSRRRYRIGFAGTSNDVAYRASFAFPLLSRSDVIDRVLARDDVTSIETRVELDAIEDMSCEIVLVLVDDPNDSTAKHLLQGREYLRFLASCAFFLAPPGFAMPVTHSLVEAMSVGTIPILNYGHLLTPPLEHGVNCLSFDSPSGLDAAVVSAKTMPGHELERMRGAVLDYHRSHLSPQGFARTLRPLLDKPLVVVVNDEGNSVARMKT